MVDETPVAAAPAAAAPAAPAPAALAPAVLSEPVAAASPATPAEAAPAALAPPVVEPAPAPAPAAEAAVPAAEAAPAADAALAEGAKPADAAAPQPEPAQPAAPKYAETLKVPEYLKIAPDQMDQFSALLAKGNATPEYAQELMDFGAGFVKSTAEKMQEQQREAFNEVRAGFVKDAEKRFGNKFDTTVNGAKSAVALALPNAKERAELWSVLAYTGAGDHPAVVKAFSELNRLLSERRAPAKGMPENGAKSGNPADRRYGRPPTQS